MLSINTNLSSMIAQQSLTKSTDILNQAIERMTTGAKLNHASDNAANYSISTNMTTQLNSYEVAQDNVASGMDLVNVASDNLSLISDHASRIRDLCIQARNGTYDKQSLKAIQSEVDARIAEIVRQYNTAEYNGIKLLNKVESELPPDMPRAGASGFIDEDFERITPDVVVTDPTQLADAIANNTTIGIANAETLAKLAELVNSGTTCEGKTITLTEDIDLSAYSTGEGWTPIGTSSKQFQGTFDGQGHEIMNLYINRPTSDYQGLFAYARGELKNVGIENCNVTGKRSVGGLVGYSYKITNCYTTGDVVGYNNFVGGLSGSTVNSVCNCYSTANVESNASFIGGLLGGMNSYSIKNCYATGNVTGCNSVGGLVGRIHIMSGSMDVENCALYSQSVTGITNVGSFIGAIANTDDETNFGEINIINCVVAGIGDLNKIGCTYKYNRDTNSYILLPQPERVAEWESNISSIKLNTTLQVGINSDDSCQITFNTDFSFGLINQLKSLKVTDENSLDFIDKFLNKISEKQTEFGAVQNRLDSALEEIGTHIENLTSSRSTLKDADIAKESSEYIRGQILQQASATLLSTANQSPSIALTLLTGIR